jgi:hypothetical protein
MIERVVVKIRRRWAFFAGLLGLSLLLVGAGRMNGEIKGRQAAALESRAECQAAVASLERGIPLESRKGWEAVAASNPSFLIKSSHGELRRLAAK